MKNIKKYLYPFAFSASFLIFYNGIVWLIITAISFPDGSYAPAAWAAVVALFWVLFILPAYCVKYSKVIVDEKWKPVFVLYNCLLLLVAHTLPFSLQGEEIIAIAFLAWLALWCVLPLVVRLAYRKATIRRRREKDFIKQYKKKQLLGL